MSSPANQDGVVAHESQAYWDTRKVAEMIAEASRA
jgi:hypothetical protein